MQNRTLSLIIGTALVMPSLAMAAPIDNSSITPADMRNAPAASTLQAEIDGPNGELLATQPGEVESDATVVETNSEEMNDPEMMSNPEEMNDPEMMGNPEEMNHSEMMGNSEEMNDPEMMSNSEEMNDPEMMGNSEAMNNPEAMNSRGSEQAAPQTLNQQHSNTEYQPLIAGEVLNGDPSSTNAPVTLQEKKKDKRGEFLATQPAEVEFSENRRVAVSR
ncbi:hypothetical protein [Psychrobacter sp. SMN/5/1215-MNA-CIBAN-0208]|uniref:hypothetical protein n=1 Tax=Psychrobacter sp. SMN/5/1215-MNA-CIBAN-0208 TaxID=3140442 RepID=UPI00331FD78C